MSADEAGIIVDAWEDTGWVFEDTKATDTAIVEEDPGPGACEEADS